MVGIVISEEQLRRAPADVRAWLQQEIANAWGGAPPVPQPPTSHLAGCTLAEAGAILSLIEGFLPVVTTFFALGRDHAMPAGQGLRALRMADLLRQTHLQGVENVTACLDMINQALQRVRSDPGAMLTALDDRDHCILADETAQNIMTLWQDIAARQHGSFKPVQAQYATPPGFTVKPG
jgi:hypothetical protein